MAPPPPARHSVRASMDFNGPLNALSVSPSTRLIAVGGRDVLKIVTLDAAGFTEKRNLRVPGKPGMNFSTNDIRWHPYSESLLATAATNGAVVIWNLEREGYKNVQERVLNGHRRAVNRICWHTTDWNVLISGSQDGTIKLWDKRGKATSTYQPKSESVRDVRASPFHATKFAVAFENGIIQVWDMRKNLQPELKFTAHKQLVLSIDWHPLQGNLLASGGRDRYVKVWDLSDLKQPRQTIQTIASVGRVAWRPNCDDHIATSASLMDNSIHVWDTHRPFIPIASMKGHMDIASGISWMDTPIKLDVGGNPIYNENVSGGNGGTPNNGDGFSGSETAGLSSPTGEWEGRNYWQHMLACSKDGTLKLHSLAHSFKHYEALPTSALALNSKGRIAFSHDYVDRECHSLKIHQNSSSASGMLFYVEDSAAVGEGKPGLPSPMAGRRASGSTLNGGEHDRSSIDSGGPLEHSLTSSSNGNGAGSVSGGIRTSSRNAVAQTPPLTPHQAPHIPPLPPRALGRSGASSNNLSANSPQLNAVHPPYQHSSSMSSVTTTSTTGSADGQLRHGASIGGALRSSPMLTPLHEADIGVPHALISVLSLQSVVTAGQLEKILHGDKDEYVLVSKKVEAMRAEFEHGRHLSVSFGFDEHAFRFLASNYKLFPSEGVTFGQMCAHNALAAFVTGNTHLCQMWRILEVLCADEGGAAEAEAAAAAALDSSTTSQRRRQHIHAASFDHSTIYSEHNLNHMPHGRRDSHHLRDASFGGPQDFNVDEEMEFDAGEGAANQTAMLLEQLDFVNPQAMEGFDPFPYDPNNPRGGQDDSTSSRTVTGNGANGGGSTTIVNGTAVYGNLSHLRHSVLKELLEYYVDIGDLQSCVTIAVVVGAIVNVEQVMGKAWMQQTLMHYIDLLHQLQIYTAANDLVRNCSDPSIRQMNMKSTSVYFNCAQCNKPFESFAAKVSTSSAPVLCSNCNNLASRCSVCQLPVRGLYVWCPVCSHGGHLHHLAEWFASETTCPTGCSHRCSLDLVSIYKPPDAA